MNNNIKLNAMKNGDPRQSINSSDDYGVVTGVCCSDSLCFSLMSQLQSGEAVV